jgi:hypothetical protein
MTDEVERAVTTSAEFIRISCALRRQKSHEDVAQEAPTMGD